MDCQGRRTEHTAAVPPDGDLAVRMVLRNGTRDGRESAIDAVNRRAIHTDAVLWDSEDDPVARRARLRGQSETDPSADAADGTGGDSPRPEPTGSSISMKTLVIVSPRKAFSIKRAWKQGCKSESRSWRATLEFLDEVLG